MTPERWQQIRDVLEKALDLAPNERSTFLEDACSSDPSLRHEVETLLASSSDVRSSFLQSTPLRVVITPLTRFGDYEVISLLGSGGMGEVYRARDSRLGRDVAIKVLPSFSSDDPDPLRRFEQEARAVAALDHPNILAVHQLGVQEGTPYLVSELLEGETLREHLRRGSLSTRKTIDYGVQIARGLAAAHEKGIVHRDLKPENLFVTKDGRVKILDFGLAKLTLPFAPEHTALTGEGNTQAGAVMGTVGYMSPEQVRGETADQRADIFAFGAILYEMVTGKRAFHKPTSAETMTAILNEEPPAISEITVTVPSALERVVHRCLEKNREQRFQSVSDLAFALEATTPTPDAGVRSVSSQQEQSQATSPRKGRPRLAVIFGALVTLVATALAVFFLFPWRRTAPPSRDAWVQVTDFADSATSPALSADGRMLAFIRGPDTFVSRGQIYVKMLPEGAPVQLTHDNLSKMAPAFSPDGSRIAYTTTDPGFGGNAYGWNSWVMPVLGGQPEELLPNAAALTWVDRQHVMFSEAKNGSVMSIATSAESRANEREVYLPTNPGGMAHRSWLSPNGNWVLIAEMDNVGWLPCRVLPFNGRSSGEIAGPKKARCTYAGWSPDGRTIYLSADAGDGFHIWRQHFPGGVPEQITLGPTEEEGIAVFPDGRSLVTSAGIQQSTVWLHDSKGDRQISGEGYAIVPGLGFGGGSDVHSVLSPDGKRLFYLLYKQGLRAYTSGELWAESLDSGTSERVLPGIFMNDFHLAPDGNRVAFVSQDTRGISHTWVAPIDRSAPPKQLTSSVSNMVTFGPGGDIYFQALEEGQAILYRLRSDEPVPRKVSADPLGSFGISPRGKWLLSGNDPMIARSPQGGPVIRVCTFCGIAWGPDGRLLYIRFRDLGQGGGGKMVVIGLHPREDLPTLPPSGLKSIDDTKGLNVIATIDLTGIAIFAPGPDPSVYAYSRRTVQRNLYEIPLN